MAKVATNGAFDVAQHWGWQGSNSLSHRTQEAQKNLGSMAKAFKSTIKSPRKTPKGPKTVTTPGKNYAQMLKKQKEYIENIAVDCHNKTADELMLMEVNEQLVNEYNSMQDRKVEPQKKRDKK